MAEGIMADLWRDFWIGETGTGQQVAQLHDRYMMMMMKYVVEKLVQSVFISLVLYVVHSNNSRVLAKYSLE